MTFKEYIKKYPVDLDIIKLNLSYGKLDDIYGIEEYSKLEQLNLSHNNISDIEPLKNLPIKELSLSNNPISDIEIILYLTNLYYLNIHKTKYIKYLNVQGFYSIYYVPELIVLKKKLTSERRKRIIKNLII